MSEFDLRSKITVTSDEVTIELMTPYGWITFTYSPDAIGEGIANLAAEILRRSKSGQPQAPPVARLGLSPDLATQAAEVFETQARHAFPPDALEKFSPTSGAYSRGVVEQFSDNVVPALILMLDYLAASALISANADSDPNWAEKVAANQQATRALLEERFGKSIRALWTRDMRPSSNLESQ